MSEKLNRPQNVPPVKWFKRAILPWAVIAITVAVVAGYIAGWMSFAHQQHEVQAQAVQMVSELSKPKQ